jgi:hypothetical protein
MYPVGEILEHAVIFFLSEYQQGMLMVFLLHGYTQSIAQIIWPGI